MVIRVENARENDCSLFCLVDSKAGFKYEIYNICILGSPI